MKKYNGLRCPNCDSSEIQAGQFQDSSGSTGYRDCSCDACHADWQEIFEITGYDNLDVPKKETSMKTIAELRSENEDLFAAAHEWVSDGWCCIIPPTPEQLAAAMLMEANTQDKCVEYGDSDTSYPLRLRKLALDIIYAEHGDKLPTIRLELKD